MNIKYIDSLEDEELKIYTELSENQLKHFYEPKPGLFIAESPVVIERALAAGYEAESVLTDDSHLKEVSNIVDSYQLPIYVAKDDILCQIKGFEMTRGALCAMKRKPLLTINDLLSQMNEKGKKRIAVMEEVQNPTNVGAIFRSAAAMGVDAIILTNGCADPLYRRAVRVSMGNVFLVPWTVAEKEDDVIELLKSAGFVTLAMALKDNTVRIDEPKLKEHEKLAIVLGTESEGLMDETIEKCDYTVKIPMMEGVDSLNVAAASAVAFWEMRTNL